MIHTPQITAARQEGGSYDFLPPLKLVSPIWKAADLAVINFETTVGDTLFTGYPRFSSPIQSMAALKEAGIGVLGLANNHICDYGGGGLQRTLDAADSLGLVAVGVYRDTAEYRKRFPFVFERNGIRGVLLNYTYGTNGLPVPQGTVVSRMDTLQMAEDLAAAAWADVRIVYLHWGAEYSRTPSRTQRKVAEMCRRYGADLIIGSHPHVLQPLEMEYRQDSTVSSVTAYSLGNFISNQRDRYTDGGMILRIKCLLHASGRVDYRVETVPVWIWRYREHRHRRYLAVPGYMRDKLKFTAEDSLKFALFLNDFSQN